MTLVNGQNEEGVFMDSLICKVEEGCQQLLTFSMEVWQMLHFPCLILMCLNGFWWFYIAGCKKVCRQKLLWQIKSFSYWSKVCLFYHYLGRRWGRHCGLQKVGSWPGPLSTWRIVNQLWEIPISFSGSFHTDYFLYRGSRRYVFLYCYIFPWTIL